MVPNSKKDWEGAIRLELLPPVKLDSPGSVMDPETVATTSSPVSAIEIRMPAEADDVAASATRSARRVIVKSGVQRPESSGGLIGFCHLDSISEFDSGNDLCQIIKASLAAPVFLRTLPKLEHHVQHPVPGQAAL